MSSFSRTVTVPRPPAEVFPWLFEADLVPRWTGNLETYRPSGPIGLGAHVRERLEVSGQTVDVDMEITRYEPPSAAQTRFSMSGLDVVTAYELREDAGATELVQTLEGKASGFKARMLVPVVQPRLEAKLTEDLDRLRDLLTP